MSVLKNVIVIGGGGNLGPSILSALHSSSHSFNISVLSRASSAATFPPYVTVHKTEYSHSSLVKTLRGQDAVVSTVGGIALSDQKKIIDAAIEAGVKRFIPSEFGSNIWDKKTLELVPVFGKKKDVVEYLRSKESDGLTWTDIITGPFFDWGLKAGFLGFDLKSNTATIFDDGNRPFSTTTIATVGTAVANSLARPSQTANKIVYVSSVVTTQNEVLAAYEKATGKKWQVKKESTEESAKIGGEKLAKGDLSGFINVVRAVTYGPQYAGNWEAGPGSDNELLAIPQENVFETVQRIVDEK
ncbi:NAD(P)-binding protein [Xylona heveae TC161]|uniref:NAD(P)-binding protein n=1 Tax=Xylona heveae (strain CBS 132557 / TC161) TaxID=1328760 RepID=A0A165GQL0_XYLHT|nr:NAD(P)-binding protein [Xylona heveae TC161]KZF22473.1 NAD(P)-binding protein [Xylona heveae TC161]